MKKIVVAFFALALVFSLISCDDMLSVMDKMAVNVAGTEQKVIEKSTEAAKAEPTTAKDNDDGSKTFSTDSKSLLSVSAENEESIVTLTFGNGNDSKVEIPVKAEDMNGVNTILSPKDISDLLEGLQSGSKSEIEEALKQPADKESKTAAEGTQKVIGAIVNAIGLPDKVTITDEMPDDDKKVAEAMNSALETLDLILGKTDSEEDKKQMTQGDVVVLTAITNIVFNNVDDVIGSMNILQKEDTGLSDEDKEALQKEKDEAQQTLIQALADEAVTMIEVVNSVPSDMASGILGIVGLLGSII